MRNLLLFFAFTLSTAVAHAQPPPEKRVHIEGEVMDATAKDLYKEAWTARERADYATCYAKVRAALGIQETPGTLALRGDCALELGRPDEAAHFLARSRTLMPADTKQRVVDHVEARLAAAKTQVATVTIILTPTDTKLSIDGKPVELVDGVAFLLPGSHILRGEHPERPATEAPYQALAGSEDEVRLELVKGAPPPPPVPAPNGNHASRVHPAWPIVTGVLAAGAIGTGIGLAVAASGKGNDVDRLGSGLDAVGPIDGACSPGHRADVARCDELNEAVEQHDLLVGASIGLLAGGVALGVVTAVLAASAAEDGSDSATVVILPSAGPTGGGLSIRATF